MGGIYYIIKFGNMNLIQCILTLDGVSLSSQ